MSRRMQLRDSIKPPTRFGELETEDPTATLLQSMRRARANGCDKDQHLLELANTASEVVLRQRAPKPKLQIVPFDPTLPPAAFPSISGMRPSGPKGKRENSATGQPQPTDEANGDKDVEMIAAEDGISMGAIENYVASNTDANPVYVKNMKAMAASGEYDNEYACNLTDSDSEEPIDDSVKLGAKIPNPKWSDIGPGLQVEIVENLLKGCDWRKVCSKLDIKKDDRERLASYLETRNQQIMRENQRLDEMRQKQLRALVRIDNSDIKRNNVPHQLVLRRIMRKATRRILANQHSDLLMCEAADFLAARQYLHRRSLDRSLAGEWGHSLVLLREPECNGLDPERFEWQENLNLSPELLESESLPTGSDENVIKSKHEFNPGIGCGDTVNPVDLMRRPGETSPDRNWHHQFSFWYPERGTVTKRSPKPKYQSNKIVYLNVGVEKAAQIHELEESGASIMHVPSAQLSSPLVAPVETPSKVHFGPITRKESSAEVPLALRYKEARPLVRSLGGPWSMNVLDPSASQARYINKIQTAKLEAEEFRLREEAQKQTTGLLSLPQRMQAYLLNQPPSFSLVPSFADEIFTHDEEPSWLEDMLLPSQDRIEEAFAISQDMLLPTQGRSQETFAFAISQERVLPTRDRSPEAFAISQDMSVNYESFIDFERSVTNVDELTDMSDPMGICDDGNDEMVRVRFALNDNRMRRHEV